MPTGSHLDPWRRDRIERVADEADLIDVYDTERHLLYVACTRARDYLLVTSGDAPSEFLDDLQMQGKEAGRIGDGQGYTRT